VVVDVILSWCWRWYLCWIAERSTIKLIYIMIIDSRDCDLEDVISRPVVTEIV